MRLREGDFNNSSHRKNALFVLSALRKENSTFEPQNLQLCPSDTHPDVRRLLKEVQKPSQREFPRPEKVEL